MVPLMEPTPSVPPRSFLFLQGMATGFFDRLGHALADRGHRVRRINFNGGDRLFWSLPAAVDYRGRLADWPAFLEARLDEWDVTDIVLFGDCRPLHVAAMKVAAARGVPVQVVEEGYLRPNWVTVEQGGVNNNSPMPRDPAWFRQAARATPAWDSGRPVKGAFLRRAVQDVVYNLASELMGWRYHAYRTHRPWHPFVEYAGWIKRFALSRFARVRTAKTVQAIAASARPYYLFPLQLDCDYQIREHSPFKRIPPALEAVIAAFAAAAPPDSLLVIKEHPLDNWLTDWRRMVREISRRHGVEDRIAYLEGGHLQTLVAQARGVVTINSTVGILALGFGRPVIALGSAIYDMEGLTFQGGLDAFWRQGTPPDPETFDAFRRVVVARTQVNGDFFSRDGLAMAVQGAADRLERNGGTPALAASVPRRIHPARLQGPSSLSA